MITKDGKDVSLDELTLENYSCPKGEELSYHVVIETKQFDQNTGKRVSVPRLQKFGQKMWINLMYSALRRQGYDMRVVHDPERWIAENRERIAAARQQAAEQARLKKESEKAAMKAEILAELKASGIIGDAETKKAGRPKKAEE